MSEPVAEGEAAVGEPVVAAPAGEPVVAAEGEADHMDPEKFITEMKKKVEIKKKEVQNGKIVEVTEYLVPKIDELEKLITSAKSKEDPSQYEIIKNTFNFMNEEKIKSICDSIEDRTEINFEKVDVDEIAVLEEGKGEVGEVGKVDKDRINLFENLRGKQFGEGDFTHIPSKLNKEDGGKFHIPEKGKTGEVSPKVNNSPPNVVYMANLFTYFFTKIIDNPNGNNKLFAVGGIFPSFLLNKELKDFDFALVSEIPNFRFYMRYLIIYFMVFVFIAKERKGKFNAVKKINDDNKIKFKEDSEPNIKEPNYFEKQIHNNNDKPLNFNVRIGDKDNGFEGLDLVLLRKTDVEGKETDLDKPYEGEGEGKENRLKKNMIQDARRRETYLNVMYASMEVKDGGVSENKTQLMVSDYFAEDEEFKKDYIAAFSKWEHLPTNGIATFTLPFTSSYRVGRIMKMYLKKWFKPNGSLEVLKGNKSNLIDLRKKYEIDLLEDQSNSLENNFFKLLSKNSEIGLIDDKVIKNIAKIFYEMDFYFLYKEKKEEKLFETRIKNMIESYLDPSINGKYDNKYFILCLAYAYNIETENFLENFKDFLALMVTNNKKTENQNSLGQIFMTSSLKELFNYNQKNTTHGNTYLKYLYYLELAIIVNYLLKLEHNGEINNKIDEFIEIIKSEIDTYLKNINDIKNKTLSDNEKKLIPFFKQSGGGKKKNKAAPSIESYLKRVNGLLLSQIISLDKNLNIYRIENEKDIKKGNIEDIDKPIKQFIELLKGLENLKKKINGNYTMVLGGKTIEDIEKEIEITEENIKDKLEEKVEGDEAPAQASTIQPGGKYHKLSKKKISNKRQKNVKINKRGKTMANKKNKTHKNSRNNNSSKKSKKIN